MSSSSSFLSSSDAIEAKYWNWEKEEEAEAGKRKQKSLLLSSLTNLYRAEEGP